MSRRLPPLNALRVFEAAARHQSFVRAAEELHVTPAAVSQQIKLLEDYLGISLFTRGKVLALSASSQAVVHLVSDALDQIERAMFKLQGERMAGPLVVSAAPAFASRWLIPRLDDFHAKHPDIELHLLATRKVIDFSIENVDVAIRFGGGNYTGLRVENLMPEKIVMVAAPELAQSVHSPEDLAGCNLLEDDWHIKNGAFPDWETFFATMGIAGSPARARRFSDVNLTIQAAEAGLGVALAWHSLVMDDLKTGRLVRLLDSAIPTALGYHLVMPEDRATSVKTAAFRDWIFDQVAHHLPD